KTGPTVKQARRAATKTSRLLPSRRQVPAPAVPITTSGQRPAGRTPQATHQGRQVPHTVSTTNPRYPHRVRGAILGRGFHRHVHATPVTHRCGSADRTARICRGSHRKPETLLGSRPGRFGHKIRKHSFLKEWGRVKPRANVYLNPSDRRAAGRPRRRPPFEDHDL